MVFYESNTLFDYVIIGQFVPNKNKILILETGNIFLIEKGKIIILKPRAYNLFNSRYI